MKWYLCGPFWDKDCNEFFNEFISGCKETSMDNSSYTYNKIGDDVKAALIPNFSEPLVYSRDTVFAPGHFKVDFNKIKSEYSPESFRRVLSQILRLDLDNIDGDTGLVVYPKGYDLGSMFELGYFLGSNSDGTLYHSYNQMRKKLIIHDADKYPELLSSINKIIRFIGLAPSKYFSTSESVLFSDSGQFNCEDFKEFGVIGINVDVYKDTPFNSILAGYLYYTGIPFFTYSKTGNESNVMMLASSLFHIKLNDNESIDNLVEVATSIHNVFWDNSYFKKFNDIK